MAQQKEDMVVTYLKSRRILVADPASSSRASLQKVLVKLGAKTMNLISVPTFEQAVDEILSHKPRIIICDYNMGPKCGLDLLEFQRKNYPEEEQHLFILCTSNASETAIADAAEESVDSYVLKPFTADKVEKYLRDSIRAKVHPSEYRKEIMIGKKHLRKDEIEDSIKRFQAAKALNDKPALACFYMGQASEKRDKDKEAIAQYKEGLSYNEIHYKCLAGLFTTLVRLRQDEDAYEVMSKMMGHFPISPQRLGEGLRLAVKTGQYEDIDRFYSVFTNLDHRTDILVKTVAAALVTAGKHYCNQGKTSAAKDVFNRAAVTCSRNPRILKEIIRSFAKHEKYEAAEDFLKMFPADSHKSSEYLTSDFLVAVGLGTDTDVVQKGRELINGGMADPQVFTLMIRRYKMLGKDSQVDSLLDQAVDAYPESRTEFESEATAEAS